LSESMSRPKKLRIFKILLLINGLVNKRRARLSADTADFTNDMQAKIPRQEITA
jgi:hypothetical protein